MFKLTISLLKYFVRGPVEWKWSVCI